MQHQFQLNQFEMNSIDNNNNQQLMNQLEDKQGPDLYTFIGFIGFIGPDDDDIN